MTGVGLLRNSWPHTHTHTHTHTFDNLTLMSCDIAITDFPKLIENQTLNHG